MVQSFTVNPGETHTVSEAADGNGVENPPLTWSDFPANVGLTRTVSVDGLSCTIVAAANATPGTYPIQTTGINSVNAQFQSSFNIVVPSAPADSFVYTFV